MAVIPGILASSKTGHLVTSNFFKIATVTASGSQSSVTFSSIPSTYKSLQLRILANDGGAGACSLNFNSDSGTNYAFHRLYGNGSLVSANGTASTTSLSYNSPSGSLSNIYAAAIVDIIDYASTSKYKTVKTFAGVDNNGGATSLAYLTSGLWQSTSAITSITITDQQGNNWTSSSTFTLYGIS